jgi:hypothetical protein
VIYHGIVPPLNNIQKMTTHITTSRGLKSRRVFESGYAMSISTARVTAVPNTVRCIEIQKELKNIESFMIS